MQQNKEVDANFLDSILLKYYLFKEINTKYILKNRLMNYLIK